MHLELIIDDHLCYEPDENDWIDEVDYDDGLTSPLASSEGAGSRSGDCTVSVLRKLLEGFRQVPELLISQLNDDQACCHMDFEYMEECLEERNFIWKPNQSLKWFESWV